MARQSTPDRLSRWPNTMRSSSLNYTQAMRYLASVSVVFTVCLALTGCSLVIGHVIREGIRTRQEESQVTASLARYKNLVIDVDPERLSSMFASDGELSHNTEAPHIGQYQILAFLKTFANYKVQEYSLHAASTTFQNDTAKQLGTYTQTIVSPNDTVIEAAGDFEAKWLHQSDGRWLLARMHTNSHATAR